MLRFDRYIRSRRDELGDDQSNDIKEQSATSRYRESTGRNRRGFIVPDVYLIVTKCRQRVDQIILAIPVHIYPADTCGL